MDKDKSTDPEIVKEDVSKDDAASTETKVETADVETDSVESTDGTSEPPSETETETETETPVADTPANDRQSRRGGFFPMVLGGLIAGGIGYGAATYLPEYLAGDQPDPVAALRTNQDALKTTTDQLDQRLSELANRPVAPDLTQEIEALNGKISALEANLGNMENALSAARDRVTVLEKRPLTEVVAPGAIAAYQAELDTLQGRVAEQLAQIETVAENATSEINAAKERAAELELQAAENARNGAARSAVNALTAAIASGGGYSEPLDVFAANSEISVPDVISANAENGVVTISNLQADFPELARETLAAARSAGVDGEEATGLSAFLKSQLNVRSLEPQDGSSVDAILSRAEASLNQGDLTAAVAELNALPEEAKSSANDWLSMAQTRLDAQMAVSQLSDALTSN